MPLGEIINQNFYLCVCVFWGEWVVMGVVGSILYVGPLHLYFCCKLKYVKLEKVPLLILKLN